jgi:DNA repair exonuclease SbcCD ATPase subunit
MYEIEQLSIRGFRGYPDTGEAFDFEFGPQLNVLYGPNRSGKSSLLLALDWLLFGSQASVMGDSGYRFMKTWTFPNRARSSTTEVSAAFHDETAEAAIHRSLSGGARVELQGEAQDEDPAPFLGLERRDYRSAVHLHQQVINQILADTPKSRRNMFYRLLGASKLQDAIDTLSDWASYKHSNGLRERLDTAVEK